MLLHSEDDAHHICLQLAATLVYLCAFDLVTHGIACRPKVSDYQPVFNLCGQSDIEVAKELTGREYTPTKYWLDTTPDSGDRKMMVRMLCMPPGVSRPLIYEQSTCCKYMAYC